MVAMWLLELKFKGSVENLKSYLFLKGYFLAEMICFKPLAKYKSNYGLKILRIELVLLMMHFKIIPEGKLWIENFYLSVILNDKLVFVVDLSICIPDNFYMTDSF